MDKFTKLEGVAAPLKMINVDTDMIIPKQYLKTIKRTGLGKGLFSEKRYKDDGSENPDFVLNKPAYRKAKILVADDNFGCGSSREHAPWALMDFGIRCVISTSFGDIFYNNCFKNGVLPIKVSPEDLEKLFDDAERGANATLSIDLEKQEIRGPDGGVVKFEIDAFRKHCMLNGLDDIGLTMEKDDKIDELRGRRRSRAASRPLARDTAPSSAEAAWRSCRKPWREGSCSRRCRLDVDHVVEARLDLLRQLAEARPFLAELGRMMRGRELLAVGPLDVVDHVAAVLAAVQADRHEAGLRGHEAGALRHQVEHLFLVVGRELDGGDLGDDAAVLGGFRAWCVLLVVQPDNAHAATWVQGEARINSAPCPSHAESLHQARHRRSGRLRRNGSSFRPACKFPRWRTWSIIGCRAAPKCRGPFGGNDSTPDFSRSPSSCHRARKSQEGIDEDRVACRRARGGARMRGARRRRCRARGRVSIASHHHDRAVPGRRSDGYARADPAEPMRASLGQPVIIENVTGAGGTIGVGRVARAAPDGYTLGIGNWTSHVGNGALYRPHTMC